MILTYVRDTLFPPDGRDTSVKSFRLSAEVKLLKIHSPDKFAEMSIFHSIDFLKHRCNVHHHTHTIPTAVRAHHLKRWYSRSVCGLFLIVMITTTTTASIINNIILTPKEMTLQVSVWLSL